jgi:uncharacterized protein
MSSSIVFPLAAKATGCLPPVNRRLGLFLRVLVLLALVLPAFAADAAATGDKVVRQQWDFSCGAAALATILTFQQNDAVTEADVIRGLLDGTTLERVRQRGGFSLLELKRYARKRGYEAEGYGDLTLADLTALGPSIVPLRLGYGDHFVVFRGVQGARVLLADPDEGTRVMMRVDFERVWVLRDAFVVTSPVPLPARDQLVARPSDFAAFDRHGWQEPAAR